MLRPIAVFGLCICIGLIAAGWRHHGRGPALAPHTLGRLHLFLPITQGSLDDPRRAALFCKTLLSALVNDYDPILYNWNSTLHGKESHKLKIFGLLDELQSGRHEIHPNDIVVMADALDVWFQLPPEDLILRYQEYNESVIVGAEMQCWPNMEDSLECRNAPLSPLPSDLFEDAVIREMDGVVDPQRLPRYANSGFVVGTLPAMVSLYECLATILKDPTYPHRHSDQGAFHMMLAQGGMAVDHHLRLVWNSAFDGDALLYMNHPRHPDGRRDTLSSTPWHLYPSLGKHLWTGETPVALHHNGPGMKSRLEESWSELWYGQDKRGFGDLVREKLRNKTVRVVQGDMISRLSGEQLCGAHLPVFA